ncbi:hypothetical protein XELAEV_18040357mg [Xenopus laevis]|uniref:Protein kinase domain-containing protein n=1 Tax=Xenopus laevis TaxID=8355 RepID=A0A974H8U1_XENLA|nr:hypothetical protein XELAEV_18040357mg [Xenopus laevis]
MQEEEIADQDKEADKLSLLNFLSWPSEEEIANSDKEADRLSLLSLLSWPSEEEIANSDIEADRLSLLSLLSWPSEEEMSDLDKEADRISLQSLLSWPSESSEEIISSGSSDMEPPMMISVTVRPKLTLAEETENQPDSSDQVHSAPRSYNLEESDHYKSQEEDSQDGNLPSGLDIGGIEIPRLDFQFETSSDSSERAYCLEAALPVIAQFRNTPEYQSKSTTPTISECTSEDFSNHSLLGEGKFGTVLLADHKYTKKKFAIKEIPKRTLDRETVQKIKTEMVIMQLVKTENAPFLVGSLASFETEYDQCLVMEYATGGDLESLMKKYDLPLKCSVFYSACIVLGLKFLHEHKIVHRDLKPGNILLDSRGYPRITDYGISKTGIGFRQLMYNECGTLPYMAPELFTEPHYTRSVDWWALGVIIYRMILGKLPFAGRNPDEIRMNIIRERPKYPLTLPAHVRNILQGLLTKNPALRLGSTIEGAQAVMDQPFFYGMDWEALRRKEIKPMFIIPSTGTATD